MKEELEKVIDTMKAGIDIETAAAYHNVRFTYIITLIKDGETETERRERGLKPRTSYNEAVGFYRQASQAKAEAMTRLIANINRAAGADWKASRFLLGKMDDKYADD